MNQLVFVHFCHTVPPPLTRSCLTVFSATRIYFCFTVFFFATVYLLADHLNHFAHCSFIHIINFLASSTRAHTNLRCHQQRPTTAPANEPVVQPSQKSTRNCRSYTKVQIQLQLAAQPSIHANAAQLRCCSLPSQLLQRDPSVRLQFMAK